MSRPGPGAGAQDGRCDVAIVGLGPSGAVAAGLLAQRGWKVAVFDRLQGIYDKPRALAVDHEILRVFQQLGCIEPVLACTEPFTPSAHYGCDGQLMRRMTMVAPPYPLGYVPSNVFNQPALETALREHLAAQPNVQLALGTQVTALAQHGDHVRLDWSTEDGTGGSTRAAYVIGCDGASSAVRGWMGSALDDLGFDEPWLVVDVLVNEAGLAKLPPISAQYCEPQRPASFLIGPGNHRRWEISINPGEDPAELVKPENTWALLSRWITPAEGQLWRQASYRFHALVADRWRNGRVFIAGDAAHQQPPFLGQGMCQGIRDVANLAWKLDAALSGSVSGTTAEDLLNSYGTERSRHVRDLTGRIKHIGETICERDPVRARQRDAKILADQGGEVRDIPRQDLIPRLETGLLAGNATTGRGTIFPQPWIEVDGQAERLDSWAGAGWWLVSRGGFDAGAVEPPGLRVIRLGAGAGQVHEREPVTEDWFARHGCSVALVRPDRYVFGTAANAAEAAALLDEWQSRYPVSDTAAVQ